MHSVTLDCGESAARRARNAFLGEDHTRDRDFSPPGPSPGSLWHAGGSYPLQTARRPP